MEKTKLSVVVKALRKEYGLTQEDLAMKSGVGLCFVRNLEQGKPTLRMDKVNQLLDLFNYESDPCPENNNGEHELQWLENRSHTESFGMLKCKCCGKTVSLEGIMNLQPLCPGDKPWEGIGQQDYAACMQKNKRSTMKWALVTSNSVYYAENFSSLYIPDDYRTGANVLDEKMQKVLTLMTEKWFDKYTKKHPGATKQDYSEHCFEDDFDSLIEYVISKADDSDYTLSEDEAQKVINAFLGDGQGDESGDVREQYRFEEFEVFQKNSKSYSLCSRKLERQANSSSVRTRRITIGLISLSMQAQYVSQNTRVRLKAHSSAP